MNKVTFSVDLEELSLEDAAKREEEMIWRSRQQLRALYFALEQDGLVDIPLKSSAVFRD